MPETRKYETNEMVDIDNSGPEVDVTLPEDKKEEVKDEQVVESNEPIIEDNIIIFIVVERPIQKPIIVIIFTSPIPMPSFLRINKYILEVM